MLGVLARERARAGARSRRRRRAGREHVRLHRAREGGVDRRHPRRGAREGGPRGAPPGRHRLPRAALRRRPRDVAARGRRVRRHRRPAAHRRRGRRRRPRPRPDRLSRRAARASRARADAPRLRTGAWWTAYLKVSEGCDHTCSFCIIPKIRGRHESRPIDDVVAEAAGLAADGDARAEPDRPGPDRLRARPARRTTSLAMLLRALAIRVPALRWIRLLYAYPSSVTDELLEVMATEPAVCRYLDMPLQHVSRPHAPRDAARAQRRGAPRRSSPASAPPCRASRSAPRSSSASPARPTTTCASSATSSRRPSFEHVGGFPLLARGEHARGDPAWAPARAGEGGAFRARDGDAGPCRRPAGPGAGRPPGRGAARGARSGRTPSSAARRRRRPRSTAFDPRATAPGDVGRHRARARDRRRRVRPSRCDRAPPLTVRR